DLGSSAARRGGSIPFIRTPLGSPVNTGLFGNPKNIVHNSYTDWSSIPQAFRKKLKTFRK
ncbi:MAG TPA: hypothetical protein PLV43_12545, partial [Aequorivita sp.]|nr:hypothetical protein [Aequorivita sp.]